MRMVAYLGEAPETEVPIDPVDIGCGAGAVPCFECGGSGWWGFAEPLEPGCPCNDCKGTGKVLVSI
jgi:hypothetical protein